jgi:EAL domain-containing protein (putative c-di-GMP-specific phosphodiesterase class I)
VSTRCGCRSAVSQAADNRRPKPDILKLDRALIQGIHGDGAKIALIEALAGFAVSTGAAVCAEGIEEPDELRMLTRLNVTYAQGYALGRPAAPHDDAVTLGDVSAALAAMDSVADSTGPWRCSSGSCTPTTPRCRACSPTSSASRR